MFKRSGDEQGFFNLKPVLTSNQLSLLSSFYSLSQERSLESGAPLSIKDSDIRYYLDHNCSHYPDDLFLAAIHMLDANYIEQRCAEIKKANKV